MNPTEFLPVALMAFGRQLGLLKPAARAVAHEAGEFIEGAAKKGLGLLGERAATPTRAPSALPEVARQFVPEANIARPRIPSAATAAPLPRELNESVQQLLRGSVNRPVGYEGRQLDMFSGMNRLTYPKGTRTAEGIAVGGRTFNPADVMPEGAYTQRIRELARAKGVPEELFMQQMLQPGKSLAEEVDFSAIPKQTGLFSKPVEFGTYQARNLINQKVGNLAELIRSNPQLAAAVGASAGLASVGYGISRMGGQNPPAPVAPQLPGPMGPITASPEVGLASDPQVAQQNQATAAQIIAAQMDPSARAVIKEAPYTGAGGQHVTVTRGQNDDLIAAKQQYTKPKNNLDKYYSQREAYANYPANKVEIISELQKRGVLDTPELVTWAGAHPTLAYELLRKATGSTTLPSQQMPQPTSVNIIAPMGSNNTNNMVGNSAALSNSMIGGSAGASDLYNATTATTNLEINPIPTDIISRLQQSVLLGHSF